MKKNYFSFLIVALMLFVAMPVSAEVKSMADLYGKYKFTATITPTEAGQQYTDLWKSECEVIITKGANGYVGTVTGLLGAEATQSVSSINLTDNHFDVINPNPNNYGLFTPYPDAIGVTDPALEDLQLYTMEYHFNPETKEITIADFAIAGLSWPAPDYVLTANVLANVTNVKMELIEAEVIVIPEIAGEWTYTPYYADNDSTIFKEFTMNVVATDDTNKNWDVTFSFEGYGEFTLPGTFDGLEFNIPYDSLYLDVENKIRFGKKANTASSFSFTYNTKTLMYQNDAFYIYKEETDTVIRVQRLRGGSIKREDPNAYKWDGTYEVSVKYNEDYDNADGIEFPGNFDMVVVESNGSYAVNKFLGYDCSFAFTPSENGKSATIDLAGYYGFVWLTSLGEIDGDYAYYILTDVNGQSTSLTVTLNEDGSMTIDDFSVCYHLWMADTNKALASMSKVSASKFEFDWSGEYTLTATVEAEGEYPAEFNVVVEATENGYIIKEFMNNDVYTLNQGNMMLNAAGKTASIALTKYYGYCFVGGSYPDYVTLNDKEGNATSLNVVYSNGAITMDDFTVYAFNWDTNESSKLATYTNVVLTKNADNAVEKNVVENNTVEGIFDLLGRKHDAITAPGLYIVNGKKVLVK